jgi:hypothetical protein
MPKRFIVHHSSSSSFLGAGGPEQAYEFAYDDLFDGPSASVVLDSG